jgi:hypothetical protein
MSARLMMIVLALGMSRPVSMMLVQASTSCLRSMNSTSTFSRWSAFHLSVGHGHVHAGTDTLQQLNHFGQVVHPVVDEKDLPAAVYFV